LSFPKKEGVVTGSLYRTGKANNTSNDAGIRYKSKPVVLIVDIYVKNFHK
jgi:hypothetical protein